MPTFCRHNRFIERCPICSKTLPGGEPQRAPARGAAGRARAPSQHPASERSGRRGVVRVQREARAVDDGYRSELLPGLRASADAERLAQELAFSSARLQALATAPPGIYADVRQRAHEGDLEQATWMCFLIAYLSPCEGPEPFLAIRAALADPATLENPATPLAGPRTSHERGRGQQTLAAYRAWAAQAGSQQRAFEGDPDWAPERRFARLFERLALPGFARGGRFELLVLLGALGLYPLRADSLHLTSAPGQAASDLTTLAAKRLFAIGDPPNLERRAAALARAIELEVGVLDLALANWGAGERATLGFAQETSDSETLTRARGALGL